MPPPNTSRSLKNGLRSKGGSAKAIPGTVTTAKARGNKPIDGAVVYQPKPMANKRIPGAVTGPGTY